MNDGSNILNLEEMAIHYQSQGLRIFPLLPGDKRPYRKGSKGHYMFLNAKQLIPSNDEIRSFWTMYPTANIGLFAGSASGVSILDIDVNEYANGFDTLRDAGLGHLIDVGLKIHTPTGGMHLMFKHTPIIPDYGNQSGTFGLDFRNSNKGYSLLPPSSAVPKYSQGGNTFVEYRFEGIEPYEFQKDLLPDFPEIPDLNFFNQLISGSRKTKNTNIKKRPYAELDSTFLPPDSFKAKTVWTQQEVNKNLQREKNKNALKSQLGNSKISQFTNSQSKLQQMVSEQGDAFEGDRPLPKKQARKAAKGLVDRLRKKKYLQVPPSKHWSYHRVYAKYQIDGIHYWVLLRFSDKYKPDSALPRVWESQDGTTYVDWEGEMVSLNLNERYPVEEYLSREIPPPSGRRNK